MQYKYIRMEEMYKKGKTSVYAVYSNSGGAYLGTIEWYNHWRQYCFLPTIDTVFSAGCLEDIIDFIKNHARRG